MDPEALRDEGDPGIPVGEARDLVGESEGTMLQATTDDVLGGQLLRIARDCELRQQVYEHLREYCHQCRNRLNSLKLSLYLAMKQSPSQPADYWVEIERCYRDLENRVEQVQYLCRPLVLSRVTLGLDLLMDDRRVEWARLMAEQGRALEFIPPSERAVASFDVDSLGRALDSVVAWRASDRSAGRLARLGWRVEDGFVHLSWDEPAMATLPEDDPEPGHPPPPWILPVLARVALAHGGDYRIADEAGWCLEIAWPTSPHTP